MSGCVPGRVTPAATQSISGYGWTNDGLYPFFPGMPCLTCGKFVGRDGYFGVEMFEMSNVIASVEGQCATCLAAERELCPDCGEPGCPGEEDREP